ALDRLAVRSFDLAMTSCLRSDSTSMRTAFQPVGEQGEGGRAFRGLLYLTPDTVTRLPPKWAAASGSLPETARPARRAGRSMSAAPVPCCPPQHPARVD